MKYSPNKLLFTILLSSILCNGLQNSDAESESPKANQTAQSSQNAFAIEVAPSVGEPITVSLSDLRFINKLSPNYALADILNKIEQDDEELINKYWHAIATKQSAQTRWELIGVVEKIVRNGKELDMLLTEMHWLQNDFHEFIIRTKHNNWSGYPESLKLNMCKLESKKLKDLDKATN